MVLTSWSWRLVLASTSGFGSKFICANVANPWLAFDLTGARGHIDLVSGFPVTAVRLRGILQRGDLPFVLAGAQRPPVRVAAEDSADGNQRPADSTVSCSIGLWG